MQTVFLEGNPPHNHLFTNQVITNVLVNSSFVPMHTVLTRAVLFSTENSVR